MNSKKTSDLSFITTTHLLASWEYLDSVIQIFLIFIFELGSNFISHFAKRVRHGNGIFLAIRPRFQPFFQHFIHFIHHGSNHHHSEGHEIWTRFTVGIVILAFYFFHFFFNGGGLISMIRHNSFFALFSLFLKIFWSNRSDILQSPMSWQWQLADQDDVYWVGIHYTWLCVFCTCFTFLEKIVRDRPQILCGPFSW